jgi:hypothetical protein
VHYADILVKNVSEIKVLEDQINRHKIEISHEQKKDAGKVLLSNLEKKSISKTRVILINKIVRSYVNF